MTPTGPVTLHERARVAGIRFLVKDARGVRVQDRVGRDLFVRRHPDHAAPAVDRTRQTAVETQYDLRRC